jgi:SET domain-containing protein
MNECKVYLGVSEINGIGVFVACNLKKGEKIFLDDLDNFIYIEKEEFDLMSESMQILIRKYAIWMNDESYYVDRDLRKPELSMYLNHSTNPNLDSVTYLPIRDIEIGEELTVNYHEFMRKR